MKLSQIGPFLPCVFSECFPLSPLASHPLARWSSSHPRWQVLFCVFSSCPCILYFRSVPPCVGAAGHRLYVTFPLGCVQKPFFPTIPRFWPSLSLLPRLRRFLGFTELLLLLSLTQNLLEGGFAPLGEGEEEKE